MDAAPFPVCIRFGVLGYTRLHCYKSAHCLSILQGHLNHPVKTGEAASDEVDIFLQHCHAFWTGMGLDDFFSLLMHPF